MTTSTFFQPFIIPGHSFHAMSGCSHCEKIKLRLDAANMLKTSCLLSVSRSFIVRNSNLKNDRGDQFISITSWPAIESFTGNSFLI